MYHRQKNDDTGVMNTSELMVLCSWQWTVVLVKTSLMYMLSVYHNGSVACHLPRLPCPKTSSYPPVKLSQVRVNLSQGKNMYTLQLQGRQNEANDGTGGDGMMVEVKGWQLKEGAADEGSVCLIVEVEVGKIFYAKTEMEGGEAGTRCENGDTEQELGRKEELSEDAFSQREIWENAAPQMERWNVTARGRLKA